MPEQRTTPHSDDQPVFGAGQTQKTSEGMPATVWVVAALLVAALLGGFLIFGRQHAKVDPNAILPIAANASSVNLTDLQMSESTSLSGGKSTYIDGSITNTGTQTLSGVILQVLFRNEEALPPQVVTLPVTLIRTRQPYVDTEPMNMAPLAPGAKAEFRLIFEAVAGNWNQQMPEIHVVGVTTK